ncbi:10976_t:CDS:2 [Funneliformis caledonium]|uniref:10976_t:CDS:1 n=1 Tax=Funneliformis caledonium TaxID=1117310 RepID=A0A9N9I7Q1_9GLOM|nr:10976_t:CDS:2 [Funneliformis caledonium]
MLKPKKHHINKDRSKAIHTDTKTRNLVECKCTLHCHGSRWIDLRTFDRHQQEIERFRYITSGQLEQNHSSYEDTPSDDEPTPTVLTDQNLIDVLNKQKCYVTKYNILDHDDPEIISDLSDDREDYEILINDEESSIEEDDHALSEDSEDNIPFE